VLNYVKNTVYNIDYIDIKVHLLRVISPSLKFDKRRMDAQNDKENWFLKTALIIFI
jgi:hypothetical protein